MSPAAGADALAPGEWVSPLPGHWRRDFRLGEWLPGPLSPSFATWFLPQSEQGFSDASRNVWGAGMRLPLHVEVNGWYFSNPGKVDGAARMLRHSGRHMAGWILAMATMGTRPDRGERVMAEPAKQHYDDTLLPAYRAAVADAEAAVDGADRSALVTLIDALSHRAGTLILPMAETLGFAGKAEFALVTLYDRHLRAELGGSHQVLLAGLVEPSPPPPHAVVSLDWCEPTSGERPVGGSTPPGVHARLAAERKAAEQRCRAALDGAPKDLARFNQALAIAQRWAVVREEMAADLTLAWPVLRRALRRLGSMLVDGGVVEQVEDVFFLERDEVVTAGGEQASLATQVDERRARRAHQALLAPPLSLGKPAGPWRRAEKIQQVYAPDQQAASDVVLIGQPGSPGRASGPVRVVRDLDDFDHVQAGDVLVAPITAPAWTPLFSVAAAVITDGGSVFAHASVIAREFGIPAVIATGDATSRLEDGQLVVVDGDRGVVEL